MRPLRTAFLFVGRGRRAPGRFPGCVNVNAPGRVHGRVNVNAPGPHSRQLMVSSGRFLGRGPGFSAL